MIRSLMMTLAAGVMLFVTSGDVNARDYGYGGRTSGFGISLNYGTQRSGNLHSGYHNPGYNSGYDTGGYHNGGYNSAYRGYSNTVSRPYSGRGVIAAPSHRSPSAPGYGYGGGGYGGGYGGSGYGGSGYGARGYGASGYRGGYGCR